jgi:hypothetical protein
LKIGEGSLIIAGNQRLDSCLNVPSNLVISARGEQNTQGKHCQKICDFHIFVPPSFFSGPAPSSSKNLERRVTMQREFAKKQF